MESSPSEPVIKVCREVLAPLVEADGGEMYVVVVNADDVHIHLAGTCAGCPGSSLTRDRVFAPALLSVVPKAKLRVTTGVRIPDGAQRIRPPDGASGGTQGIASGSSPRGDGAAAASSLDAAPTGHGSNGAKQAAGGGSARAK